MRHDNRAINSDMIEILSLNIAMACNVELILYQYILMLRNVASATITYEEFYTFKRFRRTNEILTI